MQGRIVIVDKGEKVRNPRKRFFGELTVVAERDCEDANLGLTMAGGEPFIAAEEKAIVHIQYRDPDFKWMSHEAGTMGAIIVFVGASLEEVMYQISKCKEKIQSIKQGFVEEEQRKSGVVEKQLFTI